MSFIKTMTATERAYLTQFCRTIKNCRGQKGISQEVAAENAGVGIRSYQRIESGEMWLEPQTLRALAHVLDITPTMLYQSLAERTA